MIRVETYLDDGASRYQKNLQGGAPRAPKLAPKRASRR